MAAAMHAHHEAPHVGLVRLKLAEQAHVDLPLLAVQLLRTLVLQPTISGK